MVSPDLGGGRRLRRRPGSLFTGFLLFFLLFSHLLPSPIPDLDSVSGDSDSLDWACFFVPSIFTAGSTGRAPSRSLIAQASRRNCPVDSELHRFSCRSLAGSEVSRSKAKMLLPIDSRPRSDLYTSLHQRFVFASSRLSYPFRESENSRSMCNPFFPPDRSKSLYPLNPTGVSKFDRSAARQVRYKVLTPIVRNIISKFPKDFGVLHGFNSVMGKNYCFSGIFSRPAAMSCGCLLPISYRHCSRICTASNIDLCSRSLSPTFARAVDCILAVSEAGILTELNLTGIVSSSTPDCSITVLSCRQNADHPYEAAAANRKRCLLKTLIWVKGIGPNLEEESPFASINEFVVIGLRPCKNTIRRGFLYVGYFVLSKYWTMDPIKLSM